MESLLSSADDISKNFLNMELPQIVFRFELKLKENDDLVANELKASILDIIKTNNMTPYYQQIATKLEWAIDENLLMSMRTKNEKDLNDIEERHKDSIENAGDSEILDCLFEKARHLSKIGDCSKALQAYDEILSKEKTSTSKKIDALIEKARVALFHLDTKTLKDTIAEAKKLNDTGGDWDRRNRLKIYEAIYLFTQRDLQKASVLLIDCVETFTCTEMCSYQEYIFYTIITNIITLNRKQLKEQLVNNPQVMVIARNMPDVQEFLQSIFNCNYAQFFRSMIAILPLISSDRYLGPHCAYMVREYRVLAYTQFLESYRSVMLPSMAISFGISSNLLDQELARFISVGRLNAKIDKVGDVIETIRPDKKNAQYQEVIKKGDLLLNQIQKLSRAIEV